MEVNIIRNSVKGAAVLFGAALVMAGCQRDGLADGEDFGDGLIRYSVSVAGSTKGALINTSGDDNLPLPADSSFFVSAYKGSEAQFENKKATSKDGGTWTNDDPQYWPLSTELAFFAYANTPSSTIRMNAERTADTLVYTVPTDASQHQDILLGYGYGDGGNKGVAEIRFEHPLTAVLFKEGTVSGDIKSITLSGLASGGKVAMTKGAVKGAIGAWKLADDEKYETEATLSGGEDPLDVEDGTDLIGTDAEGNYNGAFLLVPQKLAESDGGHPATVTVFLTTADGDVTVTADIASGEWKTGKTNTYTLNYGSATGFALTVTEWDEDGDTTLVLEEEIKYIDLGLSSKILWGNRNIGALTETDPGYYFPWAGTTAYAYNGSKWLTARGRQELVGGFTIENAPYSSGSDYTKYLLDSGPTILERADDASATYSTNGEMPTTNAFDELKNQCYWVWCDGTNVKYDGSDVAGYIVYKSYDKTLDYGTTKGSAYVYSTANDNHIFIPAGGYGYGNSLTDKGSKALLWTKELRNKTNSTASYALEAKETEISSRDENSRYYGFNIRTVKAGAHSEVKIGNLYWATCNIGADTRTDNGWYFSWGNTTGYVHNGSNWVAAVGGQVLSNGFTSSGYTGTQGSLLDSDIPANAQYDAARANWGGEWRMPTNQEFVDLYDSTYWAWEGTDHGFYVFYPVPEGKTAHTVVEGLSGLEKDDAALFIPAPGYGRSGWVDARVGYYWSSTKGNFTGTYEGCVYYLDSHADSDINVAPGQFNYRYLGFPIRPVKNAD